MIEHLLVKMDSHKDEMSGEIKTNQEEMKTSQEHMRAKMKTN